MTVNYPDTMQTIRDTIVARGELTEAQIDAFLTQGGEDDEAQTIYETHVAPAIDQIEDAIHAAETEAALEAVESVEWRVYDAGEAAEVIEEFAAEAGARAAYAELVRENPTGLYELHSRPVGAWEVVA